MAGRCSRWAGFALDGARAFLYTILNRGRKPWTPGEAGGGNGLDEPTWQEPERTRWFGLGSAFFVDSGGWGLEPRTGAGRRLYHQENLERCKGFFFVASLLET